MTNEIWKCMANLGWNTFLESLESKGSFLTLVLKDCDQAKEIVLKFEDVSCYRYADEGHRGKTIVELNDKRILQEGTLFSVENSRYITWLVSNSSSGEKLKEAKHYVYFDSDSCIDIVTLKEPNVEVLKNLRSDDVF